MDKKLISNIIWALTGQVGYILIGLVGTFILGRLLSPEDFGVVGIGMFFVGVFNVLVESGMGGALIRKEEATQKDYSTIFIFNLCVSVFLCLLLIAFSSFIADYYELEDLKLILIILSSILIINAFTITQNARLVKEMKFKKRGIYKFVSLFVAVLISVYIAYIGGGAWAIVAMQILSPFFLMIILWTKEGRAGGFTFSKDSFKEMYSFGLFTTLSSILNAVFDNIYQLILGKYFSVSQVGYYYQAKKIQEAPDTMYKLVILQVFYAHLSKLQSKLEEFKISYNSIAKLCAIVLGLSTCLVVIYTKEVVLIVLGEKWLNSVFYLRILAISGFFTLQEIVNRNIFKIFNKTHRIFYLELLKKGIQSISIVIGIINKDIEILLYGLVVTSIISYFINFYYSRQIISEISKKEIINFLKIVFSGTIATLLTLFVIQNIELPKYVSLILAPLFLLLYITTLYILKVENIFALLRNKDFLKLMKK